MQDVTENIILV